MKRWLCAVLLFLEVTTADKASDEVHESWGVRSNCIGCKSVQAHVLERQRMEMLHVECICPAAAKSFPGICECNSQFDWWWNLQCAQNVTVSLRGCHESVRWRLVSGNISNSAADTVETSESVCEEEVLSADEDGLGHECNSDLGLKRIGSTRRVTISLSTERKCVGEAHITWELSISSGIACTNVAQVIEEVGRGDAAELVVIVVMLCIGICVGYVFCRRGQPPSFEEKPSRYFTEIERQEGLEMGSGL